MRTLRGLLHRKRFDLVSLGLGADLSLRPRATFADGAGAVPRPTAGTGAPFWPTWKSEAVMSEMERLRVGNVQIVRLESSVIPSKREIDNLSAGLLEVDLSTPRMTVLG